jgi:3-hydroxyisobutyrate dehydrogenase-like beta-hydroxyacid dehydrogenase
MARALLAAQSQNHHRQGVVPPSWIVIGYDQDETRTQDFHRESSQINAENNVAPISLSDAVTSTTQVCILVLLNEDQCERVCFGNKEDRSLIKLLSPNAIVIQCTTVSPEWSRSAATRFESNNIRFFDCPISGGPVRARDGDLALFISWNLPSNDETTLSTVQPIWDALGRASAIHKIPGGAGAASMAKVAHQLLAGVHICAAAEALALAKAAGLDTSQFYDIVVGAAGSSWMFADRGPRMIGREDDAIVKSALAIFVKDLDLVHLSAKDIGFGTPLASAAYQQFIAAQGMGYAQLDDSQVIRVYEALSGIHMRESIPGNPKSVSTTTSITTSKSSKPTELGGMMSTTVTTTSSTMTTSTSCSSNSSYSEPNVQTKTKTGKEGCNVGDLWVFEDGSSEEILEVGQEPRHYLLLSNEYTRVLRVSFPPNDSTIAHRHAHDSLYFFLVDIDVINHVQGCAPACDGMHCGEIRYGTHVEKPLVHKITNRGKRPMLCIDAEILASPPISSPIPLVAPHHELVKTRPKCRVYRLTLEPNESVSIEYPFFHLSVILQPSAIRFQCEQRLTWTRTDLQKGDVAWKEPVSNLVKTNVGTETYIEYIAEWI